MFQHRNADEVAQTHKYQFGILVLAKVQCDSLETAPYNPFISSRCHGSLKLSGNNGVFRPG